MLKVAILSRPNGCFPNVISIGLADLLYQLEISSEIFYDAIPFLMRMLPMNEKPAHWSNSLHYRIYNKLRYYQRDKRLLKKLADFDLIVVSECLPNSLWNNYLAIEQLRKKSNKKIGSYNDGSIDVAPGHRQRLMSMSDKGDERYDFNLFVSEVIEERLQHKIRNRAVIGLNLEHAGLGPIPKEEFIAIVDFAQQGFESYKDQQLNVLKGLGIKTIVLEGTYELDEIRRLYKKAAIFFLGSTETFGLPIAECLACGAYVFTPDSSWPMAWRLDEHPVSGGPGILPECFKVYNSESELREKLTELIKTYDSKKTPLKVFDTFL